MAQDDNCVANIRGMKLQLFKLQNNNKKAKKFRLDIAKLSEG